MATTESMRPNTAAVNHDDQAALELDDDADPELLLHRQREPYRVRRRDTVADEHARQAAMQAAIYEWQVESEQMVGPAPDTTQIGALEPLEDCVEWDPSSGLKPFGNGVPAGLHVINESDVPKSTKLPNSQVLPSGQLVAILAPPKVGKTLCLQDVAARRSRGEPVLDLGAGTPSRTLIVAASEGGEASDHWPRLHAANVDPEYVCVITNHRHFLPFGVLDYVRLISIPDDLDRLEVTIRRMKPALVVINTLRALATDPTQTVLGAILDRLAELAQQHQITIVVVDYNDNSWRSRLVEQRARVVLDLSIGADGVTRRLRVKYAAGSSIAGRCWNFRIDGVNDIPKITWLGSGYDGAMRAHRGPAPRQDLRGWLTTRLKVPELREVVMVEADTLAYPRVSVDRAFRRLGGKSKLLGDGTARVLWHVP